MRNYRREMLAYRLRFVVRSAWRWSYAWLGLVVFCGVCWLVGELVEEIARLV